MTILNEVFTYFSNTPFIVFIASFFVSLGVFLLLFDINISITTNHTNVTNDDVNNNNINN